MTLTNFPNGVSSYGIPLVGSGVIPTTGGSVFWVHSGTGLAGNDGTDKSAPLTTIDGAINKCTSNKGDVVVVLPGHSETLTASITCDIAGVTIIGLGEGTLRPQLTVNAAIDGITITADNVTLENLYFNEATNAGATANINIAAANAKLRRIHMDCGANDVDVVTITAAGELPTVEGCTVLITANGPDSWLKFEGVIDRPIVRHNVIVGSDGTNPYDDGVFDFNNQAVTNPAIYGNVFNGGNQAVTVVANGGNVVAAAYGPNTYAGSATNADNVATITAVTLAADSIGASEIADGAIDAGAFAAGAITAAAVATGAIDADAIADNAIDAGAIAAAAITNAKFAAGAIDAAAIAPAAIDAATFAADALQAIQDEGEDALEGENLDRLAAAAVANNADMTLEVVDGSILCNILTKAANTSDYNPATDSLEMASDKLGGFSGDGGAAQDDSVKASLDLAHTMLGAADGLTTDSINGKLGTDTELSDRSLYDLINGGGPAAAAAAAVPGNDVSLYAVTRDIWDAVRNGTGGLEPGTNRSIVNEVRGSALNYNAVNYLAVTVDLSQAGWNTVTTHTVLAVTGLVRLRLLIECTVEGNDTSGDTSTIQLGYTGTTNAIIAATQVDDLAAGEIWIDATPTETYGTFAGLVFDLISNGIDVGFEIAGEAATAGTLIFHCWWEPLNATGAVVAGTGQVLA